MSLDTQFCLICPKGTKRNLEQNRTYVYLQRNIVHNKHMNRYNKIHPMIIRQTYIKDKHMSAIRQALFGCICRKNTNLVTIISEVKLQCVQSVVIIRQHRPTFHSSNFRWLLIDTLNIHFTLYMRQRSAVNDSQQCNMISSISLCN